MPSCDSLYDYDNIYAMKTPRSGTSDSYAHITTFHTDGDGYLDIRYCYIAGYSGETRLWELRYRAETDSYSMIAGSDHIGYVAGTETRSGNYLDITWHIEFKFTHPDVMNMDIRVKTIDSYTQMTTTCDTNWDV